MSKAPKKKYTDAERLELASKLDKELDEFIAGLEKKPYTDGWSEDRWEEEMEKHPFFMTKAPEAGGELNPLYEGLQQLKYDPLENTPEELATSYKEDGNYNFKFKNYRLAIIAYTEAIKVKCGNKDIEATLYNNRSAANYFLKNYRSCLRDCKIALRLKPDYDKAFVRAANCCYEIGNFQEAVEYCDQILEKGENKEILELRKKSSTTLKKKERDRRLAEKKQQKSIQEERLLLSAMLNRGAHIGGKFTRVEDLEPALPQLQGYRVHLGENGILYWPVVFFYPEYKYMDFIQEFGEDECFLDHLKNVFQTKADWDKNNEYKAENLNVYFKNEDSNKFYPVELSKTLRDIVKIKEFVIYSGTPSFTIVVKNSDTEKKLCTNTL